MTNGNDHKSMDDVLASIRRIVRAEKDPESDPGGQAVRRPGDEPLALTPDMRTDASSVDPEAIARPADSARPGSAPTADAPGRRAAAAPDAETLRRMIREVLIEELASGGADEAVRDIIRDELTNGEIGANISQNVLRLIQSEVARTLDER